MEQTLRFNIFCCGHKLVMTKMPDKRKHGHFKILSLKTSMGVAGCRPAERLSLQVTYCIEPFHSRARQLNIIKPYNQNALLIRECGMKACLEELTCENPNHCIISSFPL